MLYQEINKFVDEQSASERSLVLTPQVTSMSVYMHVRIQRSLHVSIEERVFVLHFVSFPLRSPSLPQCILFILSFDGLIPSP